MIVTRGMGFGGGLVAVGFGAWLGTVPPEAPVVDNRHPPSVGQLKKERQFDKTPAQLEAKRRLAQYREGQELGKKQQADREAAIAAVHAAFDALDYRTTSALHNFASSQAEAVEAEALAADVELANIIAVALESPANLRDQLANITRDQLSDLLELLEGLKNPTDIVMLEPASSNSLVLPDKVALVTDDDEALAMLLILIAAEV